MFVHFIQRNATIGQGEVKTQKTSRNRSKTTCLAGIAGHFRPFAAVCALAACTFVAASRESNLVGIDAHAIAASTSGTESFQRADIIDDIIDVIEKILNPPPPPPSEP